MEAAASPRPGGKPPALADDARPCFSLLAREKGALPAEILKPDRAAGRRHQPFDGGEPRLADRRAAIAWNEAREQRGVHAHDEREILPGLAGSKPGILETVQREACLNPPLLRDMPVSMLI